MGNRNDILKLVCYTFAVFVCGAILIPDARYVEILRACLIPLSAGLVASHAMLTWEILRGGETRNGDSLNVAIFLFGAGTLLASVWSLFWRLLGQPRGMADNDFIAFFLYLLAVACVLVLMVPRTVQGRVPPTEWLRFGIKVSIWTGAGVGFLTAVAWWLGVT